jgi:hypothetical protein
MTKHATGYVLAAAALALLAVVACSGPTGSQPTQRAGASNQNTDPYGGVQPASQAPTSQPHAEAASGVTVYVTRTGECYHRLGCSSLRKSCIPTPLSEARQSYRPCQRCHPPQ